MSKGINIITPSPFKRSANADSGNPTAAEVALSHFQHNRHRGPQAEADYQKAKQAVDAERAKAKR